MSSYLWKAYYEDDVFAFQQLLQNAATIGYNTRASRSGNTGQSAAVIGSPVGGYLGSSPTLSAKGKKTAGGYALTKADINARDATGQTLLHHAASSRADTAMAFATALLEHPLTDLYLQDFENGWTALHRAFYFGNVTIARLILERGSSDAFGKLSGPVHPTSALIKVKDREGLGPLDLFTSTIKDRTLRPHLLGRSLPGSDDNDEDDRAGPETDDDGDKVRIPSVDVDCDQLFTFGSNQNVSLGFGDEDDRQFPERVTIRRPEHFLRGFYVEHLDERNRKLASHDPHHISKKVDVSEMWIEDIPYLPKSKQLKIQDVQMSKLHTAVLTSDSEANLYMCGHGKSGRLGTGDERTRFNLTCIETGSLTGKRVASVALGLNHSLALCEAGEIFSWGNNGFGQLGYSLPKSTTSDEDLISTIPRQIFGPLKRETVLGIAASRIHSVAHTGSSLFTFGKNEGQLGIMDSDARSLEQQVTPRKVAASLFSTNISAISAMDKATVCLLDNHEVWVFANFGYAKVPFPLEGFSNYFLKESFLTTNYDQETNRIVKLTCGGDTICALSSKGEIFTVSISQRQDKEASSSTTNPAKIRSAITKPQRIWTPKKNSMVARDVGVDADGSIILSTDEGSVWKRTKRATLKDATASGVGENKPDSFKFSRIPGLTRVLAVRASAHGAYAALRSDCDVTKTQIVVEDRTLWKDLWSMLSLRKPMAEYSVEDEIDNETRHRFWQGQRKPDELAALKRAILQSKDVEADLAELEERSFADPSAKYDALIATTTSDIKIPVHRFVLTGRSRVLRRGFRDLCETSTFTIPDLAVSELDKNGVAVIKFQGLDVLTVLNLVMYLYTDSFIDFWHLTRDAPKMAFRYRQIRTELMKVATKLELNRLEPAARQMVQPRACLDMDFEVAFQDPAFYYDGDIVVQLEDDEVRVHSALVRARCPFFEGLFMGRAGGRWLAGRDVEDINVDLSHINAKTFTIVLRHIYADTGSELFDDIVSVGMDDFLDSVMDVMSAANELMLERLSQVCQEVIGRFVNVRNVCGLLNAISPSSVREFKDAALEYLCLSLESMLQGHYLNELDQDLLEELDDVVRENQLAYMPFARSGRAEQALFERNPELAETIERNRQSKIDAVALRVKHHGLETFKPGSLGDDPSPLQQKARRRSSYQQKSDSPLLKGKASSKDLVFEMDEEFDPMSPSPSPSIRPMTSKAPLDTIASSPLEDAAWDVRGKQPSSTHLLPKPATPGSVTPRTPRSPLMTGTTPPSTGQPWSLTPLPGAKTDMKDIMAQAAGSRTSSLSQGLAASMSTGSPSAQPVQKMSQKERKRQQQQTNQPASPVPQAKPSPEPSSSKPTPAWQTVSGRRGASIKDILNAENSSSSKPNTSRSPTTPQLTMRQTVANSKPAATPQKPVIGPAGQGAVQQRSVSESKPLPPASPKQGPTHQQRPPPPPPQLSSGNSKPIPQSIRHQPPPIDNALGLSMSEIVAQQQLEKDIVKEAVQKRDLHDIQAEQEFQVSPDLRCLCVVFDALLTFMIGMVGQGGCACAGGGTAERLCCCCEGGQEASWAER